VQNAFDWQPCPGDHATNSLSLNAFSSVSFDQVKNAVAEVLAQTS